MITDKNNFINIVSPSVELWTPKNVIQHVARCARVCYNRDEGNDDKTFSNLLVNGHNSVFRHYTYYYIVKATLDNIASYYAKLFYEMSLYSKIVGVDIKTIGGNYYIAMNFHYIIEHPGIRDIFAPYKVDEDYFSKTEGGHVITRYTFACITQISTSRELNRVSPNNICEESTRYVYEDGSIVRPHWMDRDITAFYINSEQSKPLIRIKDELL